ncbi:UL-16 binding protein 5-like [Sturnira hondurensis]|uniref:UL-16 binding protein 5-like n=1 Tax=Sturnira hondurensis TaxID=192404 RepID=UPI00187B0902|nr:UL-16 binding protein 5-like [Sturnira hondurensis]
MNTAGFKFGLALVVLTLLLSYAQAGDSVCNGNNVPSLSYRFIVSASGPSQYKVEGKFNGTTFFKYTSEISNGKPINPLGVMLSATEAWNQLVEHWKDLVEELRKALLNNRQNISKAFYPLFLQGHMVCQQESTGHFRAFWKLGFDGWMCLRFNSKNRHWKELNGGCRSLKKTLGPDRDTTNLLVSISHGDSKKLFNEIGALDTKEDAAPKLL